MVKPPIFNAYMRKSAASESWCLKGHPQDGITQVVVIPAFAEKEMLFSTLASLARNNKPSLKYSFILCVINNKRKSPDDVKINNRQTMKLLDALMGEKPSGDFDNNLNKNLQLISNTELRTGYIDASSAGKEIPDNEGGVGMARKIGMDMALRILQESPAKRKLILSLDADTLVRDNYLASVNSFFDRNAYTAVVAYEHTEPDVDEERAAIYCYETFLRYWVLGLRYAKSPYAFHSIGSTIVCSTDAYLKVRGMNRREAGEDFYFLNKLAKIGKIDYIKETCVYPSARMSFRVPFGTGKRIKRFLSGAQDEYLLYHPRIFEILRQWLSLMQQHFQHDERTILKKAALIDPLLVSFLNDSGFTAAWPRIRHNFKDERNLISHFHSWFDGFKTLKLINFLTRESYGPVNMFAAVEKILSMKGCEWRNLHHITDNPDLSFQKNLVQYLRKIT